MAVVDLDDGTVGIKFGDGVTEYNDLPFFVSNTSSGSSGFVSGMIMLWSGSADNIPIGWALCNGEKGTPDLRDRFVVGAGSAYVVGDMGGEAKHILTKDEMPSHLHALKTDIDNEGYNQTWAAWTEWVTGWTQTPLATSSAPSYTQTSGGGEPHNNIPPYYALCYIMKI